MLKINKLVCESAVDFAAEELKKYLRMMMPEGGDIKIEYAPEAKDGFRLGLMGDLGLDISDAEKPELDDVIYIDTDTDGGVIAGSNPRAVLIAVYEYLRKNGCEWLMPGIDGEYIPMKDIVPVKYRHKPPMRHRGNCIEGAVSQQILADFIDYMPKIGLNCFMVQFKNPFEFYIRHYDHRRNAENRKEELITTTAALQWTRAIECEISRRGIMLHSVGHGWTTEPFGIDSVTAWNYIDDSAIPEKYRQCLAQLDGKRGFYYNKAINTQICMSNTMARRMFVENICDYASNHSNVDYLHIWLADASNNHCECDDCNAKRTSDWYVIALNEIDRELACRGLKTRIVFIIYVDTLWAPIEEKLINSDRFTLMIAPISRDYTFTASADEDKMSVSPYIKNKLPRVGTLSENMLYLAEWRKMWRGSVFAFDYHFWKHHQFDLSGLQIAERLYEDTGYYLGHGVEGIMQCGSQRGFFPNGFAHYVHARAQFDLAKPLSELERDYYSLAYGEDWEMFRNVLKKMSDAVPYEYMSYNHATVGRDWAYKKPEMQERIESLVGIADELMSLVQSHYNSDVRVRTVAVRLLERYAKYIKLLSVMMSCKSVGRDEEAMEAYNAVRIFLGATEAEFGAYDDNLQKTGFLKLIAELKCKSELNDANGD